MNRYFYDKKGFNEKNDIIQLFVSKLDKLLSIYKVVLFFDNTECCYSIAMELIEEYILEPFIGNENLILVCAGQQRLKWRSPRLRRQVEQHSLTPLSKKDCSILIERLASKESVAVEGREYLLDKMWHLTLGHPLSFYNLFEILSNGFVKYLNRKTVDEYYRLSIQELINRVIKHRILERVELGSDYPDPVIILSYLAPLRFIESSTIHFILSHFLPEWFEGKPFSFFEELIAEFQKQSHIFIPWILGAGFDVEPVTRNILLADLRLNRKEKFIAIQKALIEQYGHWIDQTRDAAQIKNIIERLYHRILLMHEEHMEIDIYEISKELKGVIERIKRDTEDTIQISEQIIRLKNALKRDKELNEMIAVHELLDIIEKEA